MKILKKIVLLLAIVALITIIPTRVSAVSSFSQMQSQANSWLQQGSASQPITETEIKEKLLPIANILVGIATIVFLIVGSILGAKYMMSGADDKAKLKEKLIWFVIAMVAVYGAVGIFNLIINVMNEIV